MVPNEPRNLNLCEEKEQNMERIIVILDIVFCRRYLICSMKF